MEVSSQSSIGEKTLLLLWLLCLMINLCQLRVVGDEFVSNGKNFIF